MSLALARLLDRAARAFEATGDGEGLALIARRRGDLALRNYEPVAAAASYRDAVVHLEGAESEDLAAALLGLARALLEVGEADASAVAALEAGVVFEGLGHRLGQGLCRVIVASATDGAERGRLLRAAVDDFIAGGHPGCAIESLCALASHHAALHEVPLARHCVSHANALDTALGLGLGVAVTGLAESEVLLSEGRPKDAMRLARQTAEARRRSGDLVGAKAANALAARARHQGGTR